MKILGQTINKCGQCNKEDYACAFPLTKGEAAITGGVLAGIIIGIFAGVVIVGYSSKKGLQYILSKQVIILLNMNRIVKQIFNQLKQGQSVQVKNNPAYVGDVDFKSPLYEDHTNLDLQPVTPRDQIEQQ